MEAPHLLQRKRWKHKDAPTTEHQPRVRPAPQHDTEQSGVTDMKSKWKDTQAVRWGIGMGVLKKLANVVYDLHP